MKKAKRARGRASAKGAKRPEPHARDATRQRSAARPAEPALTFAIPGKGVVDAKGKAVAPPPPPVTGSQVKVSGIVPKLAGTFVAKPDQAPYHPEDCPGCATPGFVAANGWPVPCKCWTAPNPGDDPTDTGDLADRRWRGGDPISVQTHTDKPATFHRYFCPFFDHFPEAIPF